MDLIVNNINDEAGIFKNNNGKFKNYISISLKGNDGNTFGIGCKAYLFYQRARRLRVAGRFDHDGENPRCEGNSKYDRPVGAGI